MQRIRSRITALCICAALLLSPLGAWAEAEEGFEPITRSSAVRTADGVVITGERAMVDFEWLKAVNADSVGWLYQEETAFSQPVLMGKHNDYYYKLGFDGTNVGLKGLAYLDADARPAMDESRFVILGSGRQGGALESLNQYQHQAYYEAHPSLRLLTPNGDWQADVFACIKTTEASRHKWLNLRDGESFEAWLQRLASGSAIQALAENVPAPDERIAAFTMINSDNHRRMVFAALRPIVYQTEKDVNLTRTSLDTRPTISGWVDTGRLGRVMVYAQNDPLWSEMRYESELTRKFRRFGGGGCGPTAVAIALANLVDAQELPKLREYSLNGLGALMCTCSVNRVYCNHLHAPYHLEGAEAYLRYLPIIVADFAAGNNQWKINSRPGNSQGTNMRFLEPLCEIFGLRLTSVDNLLAALEMLKQNGNTGMVVCCALRGSPFTTTSHYMVIAGVDDTHFYVLDPLYRDDYSDTDHYGVIDQILAPGVVKIKLEDARKCGLSMVGHLQRKRKPSRRQNKRKRPPIQNRRSFLCGWFSPQPFQRQP